MTARKRRVILVGGSGLYLRAAVAELKPRPQPDAGERERFTALYDRDPQAAYQQLKQLDPVAAGAVHANDRRRVVRGLELHAAGTSLAPSDDSLWKSPPRVPTVIVGLELDRQLGDRRIESRTRAMFDAGVVEEVQAARAAHAFSHTAARIHGLQDVTAVLDGDIDREEAIRRLVLRTRQYAKRQRTWMRRIAGVRIVDAAADPGSVCDRCGATAVTQRRESDAVREARDAFVIVVACAPIALVVSALVGTASKQVILWQERVTAPIIVAALLLGTLASALVLADRAGRHVMQLRPHPVNRVPLIIVALVAGVVLVAGIPTTWPIVIGCAIVCAVLGAVIVVGSLFQS